MKSIAIKVKNRKQLDKATEILKKQGLKLDATHNEQWIEKHINWAFENDRAFVLVSFGDFGYHNHDGNAKIIKYNKFKNKYSKTICN